MKKLSAIEKHQYKIAVETLRMNSAMVRVLGGMTKKEAYIFLKNIGLSESQIKKIKGSRK
ncbi:hypothetical protein D6827_01985 [Candidatus Parcubacteria bacterium]|nr:MAG: hypothetical protein D6827_01985 [Candidatus Parcubacteria bacterium]